jgi:hypothetical protein
MGADDLRSVGFGKVAQGDAFGRRAQAGVDAVDLGLDGVEVLLELGGTDEVGGGLGGVVADDAVASVLRGDGGALGAQAPDSSSTPGFRRFSSGKCL